MNAEFKVFYDNTAATKEMLDEIDEITVEQQIDRVWEARIKIPVSMNDEGVWEDEENPRYREFTRVRIEVRIGEGDFVPLIDGKTVRSNPDHNASPGRSSVTLVVQDDSVLLHREDEVRRYEAAADSDIAQEIFGAANLGETPDVEPTPVQPDNPAAAIMQRGTKMQILRSLAARHRDFHAYVLPGKTAGTSIGCFKKLPELPDESLPVLVMFGTGANLAEFNLRNNPRSASEVVAASMSLRDKSILTGKSSYRDAKPLGEETSTAESRENLTVKRLPPGQSDTVDLNSAAAGEAASSALSIEADGSVLPFCYTGVLSPYRVVPVRLSDSRYSTNYVIFKVTHTLTRSQYTQSFTVKGNAVSAKKGGGGPSAPAASASAAVSFNIQVDIF